MATIHSTPNLTTITAPRGTYTIKHNFTGWWVAFNGTTLHIHPYTTEHAAQALVAELGR